MKLDDALANATRLFLDTAPVIYFVERNPLHFDRTANVFARVDRDEIIAVTSIITLAESLILPLRQKRTQLQRDFNDLIVRGRNAVCLSISLSSARHAAELRAFYNLTLTDALQIAAALGAGCEAFLTNDTELQRVKELRVLVLDQLEL
jgi:predicted nucleic acid-binding protein